MRRRRRQATKTYLAVAAAALLLALPACDDSERPLPPQPPDGTRYVGIGRAVVAVPEDWPLVTAPCGAPAGSHVYPLVQEYVAARCLPVTHPPEVTVGIGPLDGVALEPTDVTVKAENALFRIVARDGTRNSAGRSAEEIRASLRLLPEGWTTVPILVEGISEDDAARLVEAAGLEAERPDVDWPHYVTGTDPAMGSVVRVGAEVELVPGDG